MKKLIRIFNIVIMAVAATCMILLLTVPAINFSVGLPIKTDDIAELVPEGEEEIDVKEILGGEEINLSISLKVSSSALFKSVSGDAKEVIDEEFIDPNLDGIIGPVKDLVHVITKGTFKVFLAKILAEGFEESIKDSGYPGNPTDLRNQYGLDDAYFKTLTVTIIDAMDDANVSITSITTVMLDQLEIARQKFNKGASVSIPVPSEETKQTIRDNVRDMFKDSSMVKEDGEHLYTLSVLLDSMATKMLREMLDKETPSGETLEEAAAQLAPMAREAIKEKIPEEAYDTLAMVFKIMLIVIIVMVVIYAFLLVYTLLRTLLAKKKIWTFTGFFFWFSGFIQIILGVVLTVVTTIVLPQVLNSAASSAASSGGEAAEEAANMLNNLSISVYTCTFVPSIFVLLMIPFMIVYAVFKGKYKRQLKAEAAAQVEPKAEPVKSVEEKK